MTTTLLALASIILPEELLPPSLTDMDSFSYIEPVQIIHHHLPILRFELSFLFYFFGTGSHVELTPQPSLTLDSEPSSLNAGVTVMNHLA